MDGKSPSLLAVAVCCVDLALRHRLERALRKASGVALAAVLDQSADLVTLAQKVRLDVVVLDALSSERLADGDQIEGDEPPFLVLIDAAIEQTNFGIFDIPVRAVLPDTAAGEELVAAVKAVAKGYVVLPQKHLARLIENESASADALHRNGAERPALTPRETEVLAAMANGASNKAIARRLGISFHTAKFHVAAILTKFDADTRTEAVAKAAQLGLVML